MALSGQLGSAQLGLFQLGQQGLQSTPIPNPPATPGRPLAAHTFDFIKLYTSERDLAPPGSGTWGNTRKIFDGLLFPAFATGGTFSSGSLFPGDPHSGIVTQAKAGLAFLGNGLPAAPQQINSDLSLGYWDTAQGAFFSGGIYYLLVSDAGTIKMINALTNAAFDPTNGPQGAGSDGSLLSIAQRGTTVYVFATTDGLGDVNWAIWPFDLTTGKWGTSFAPVNIPNFGVFSQFHGWVNSLFPYSNGDFGIVYQQTNNQLVYRLWSGAIWGAPINIDAAPHSFGNSVMDSASETVYVIVYQALHALSAPLVCFSVSHPGSVVTGLAGIPSPIGSTLDSVGHCSIQNGMLFVPRDDRADFDNTIWVAALPAVSQFFGEHLPIPPGETGVISLATLNGLGTGYVVGDTGFLNGGILSAAYVISAVGNNGILSSSGSAPGTGYAVGDQFTVNTGGILAVGQVTSIGAGGAVTGYVLINLGQGYALASGVATTATSGIGTGLKLNILSLFNGVTQITLTDPGSGYAPGPYGTFTGGTQPGSGTGLTVTVIQTKGKTPSCAYMMFPTSLSSRKFIPQHIKRHRHGN